MRLSSFNVESLFERPQVMNLDSWSDGKVILEDYARLNDLIQSPTYTDKIKTDLLEIMKRYKGLPTTGQSTYIRLNESREKLLKQKTGKPVEIGAGGRGDWIGWFELVKAPIREAAIENTARVIDLLKTDIISVIEAEDRISLKKFNDDVFRKIKGFPFDHIMLIDGNDERGIDVGLMTRQGFPIVRMLSHVDDRDEKGIIFSRDCAEYEINTPNRSTLLLLVNHFKSKGYGKSDESAAKRLRQAKRVRAIYDGYVKKGYDYIAVLGDLNETPDQYPLDPLIRQGSDLLDIMAHRKFKGDGRPGTHGNGTKAGKFDYILMSPKLSAKVTAGGIERRGVWGGTNGQLFPHLESIKKKVDAASDHAALWVDVNI